MSQSLSPRWQVRAMRPVAYDIAYVDDIFDPANPALLSMGRVDGGRRFVVVDETVLGYHGARIRHYFAQQRIEACVLPFSGGEAGKSIAAWRGVLDVLDQFPIHRRDEPILAIGGGVLTDVVGFVASSYRRGVPHIKVPTTLMGLVDAAIGVKAGINFNGSKNRLGSFEPPARVLLDRALLRTLPWRHLANGLCEIIKLALIKDATLFGMLERNGAACLADAMQGEAGHAILDRAIDGMLEELAPNLFEAELARAVDFGHTFSPGLESRYEAELLHGEAVLLDMLVSSVIAQRRGLLAGADALCILNLPTRLGIQPALECLDVERMWQSLLERIEHRNGLQRVPLPAAIGVCHFVNDITRDEIANAIGALREWMIRTDE